MESCFLIAFLLFCWANNCYGGVLFLSLPRTLVVTASPNQEQVLKAGEDKIKVRWSLNQSHQAARSYDTYKNVKVTLCYAPVSQIDRPWRKTENDLSKDKTCQFTIVERPYDSSMSNQSFEWMIQKDVPTATYFVRVYAYNTGGEEVAFGQTTDDNKSSNLFDIQAITGRYLLLEIASACISAFSVVFLFGFILVERRKGKGPSRN